MARLTKKKVEKKGELGSGKPYDGCREVEVTLVIPVVSWGWQLDEGEEEERIRTEEQVVRQKEEPRVKFLYVSRDTGRGRRDIEVGTHNPHIRECD